MPRCSDQQGIEPRSAQNDCVAGCLSVRVNSGFVTETLLSSRVSALGGARYIAVPIRVRYAKTFDSQLLQPLCMYLI